MKRMVWFAAGFLCLSSGAAFAATAEKKAAAPAAQKQPAMTPEQKAQMDAMMKAMTPGDAHKKLDPLVGTFEAKVSMWMAPGAPPEVSTGTSVNAWALGGRFVEQHYTGTAMGQPFSGIGYSGYDNIRKQYVSTWIDTMSTAPMISTGSLEGNVMNSTSSVDDPVSGKPQKIKEKLTITDKDHHKLEMWSPAPDGKMFKMMEITYNRKK
jgi:Protein of unknown function (DUF1579)